MKQFIQLTINGLTYDVVISPEDLLIDVLRQQLGLTGTKKGCGQGDCGTCTVLIDGKRALACITLAIACQGKAIETIEGLEEGGGWTRSRRPLSMRVPSSADFAPRAWSCPPRPCWMKTPIHRGLRLNAAFQEICAAVPAISGFLTPSRRPLPVRQAAQREGIMSGKTRFQSHRQKRPPGQRRG